LLIIATSIGLGLGVTFHPEFINQFPKGLKMIFSSGISTGTSVALILKLVLTEEKSGVE
jgi:xanthine/uracil permease